jgi:hypothetical protein
MASAGGWITRGHWLTPSCVVTLHRPQRHQQLARQRDDGALRSVDVLEVLVAGRVEHIVGREAVEVGVKQILAGTALDVSIAKSSNTAPALSATLLRPEPARRCRSRSRCSVTDRRDTLHNGSLPAMAVTDPASPD